MTDKQIGTGHLSFDRYGSGDKIIFAFHGFGQNKNIFKDWTPEFGKTFTMYSFDLYYHGESIRPHKPLSKNEWASVIEEFIKKEQIKEFSILGYSLGGRFAISTALSFPTQTKELTLIAPDGIFLTIWFKLATTPFVRLLWKYFMVNPDKLERLLAFNDRRKLFSSYVSDFVRKQMGNAEERKRVYVSWNNFKSLGYSRRKLITLFRRHSFSRRLVVGSQDHIITPKGILPLIERMGGFDVHVLDKKHHQLLDMDVARLLFRNH